MQNKKVDELHQAVIEAADKVQSIIKNHEVKEDIPLTFREKFSDSLFDFGSTSRFIFLFAAIVTGWVVYNISVPPANSLDVFPFRLLGFILTAVAAIQAPIIMMSQHRQTTKLSNRIAVDLKVDNQILSHHRSIIILMEEQMQELRQNQILAVEMLKELHVKLGIPVPVAKAIAK